MLHVNGAIDLCELQSEEDARKLVADYSDETEETTMYA